MPTPLARGLAGVVRALERVGFAVATGVVTYTPEMARQLDLHPEAPDVYPTGARYVRTDEFRVERPYSERDRVVGFLGRLDEEKGIRELAAVASDLPDDITFRFIGDGDLGAWLEAELDAEISNGDVELTGWVDHDDVPGQLNDLALLVLPSQPTEGLPTTTLEALACGTPVLASPVSGVPDVVQEGETGFLIESRDPATLTETITRILSADLEEISDNGRALVETKYSFEKACDRYRDILRSVSSYSS